MDILHKIRSSIKDLECVLFHKLLCGRKTTLYQETLDSTLKTQIPVKLYFSLHRHITKIQYVPKQLTRHIDSMEGYKEFQ